jgi:2'-5' RNA ligase
MPFQSEAFRLLQEKRAKVCGLFQAIPLFTFAKRYKILKEDAALERYFIAIIPPSPILEEVMELKNYFKEKYNSKASLNSPPHITLHMPFQWKEEKESLLIERISSFAQQHHAFEISLLNFGSFETRVIFIDVIKNESLEKLQKELQRFCKRDLNLFNANYKEHAYHPHLTLAFRDLRKSEFIKAWEEFSEKKFRKTFSATSVVLLKHDGEHWQIFFEACLRP